MAIRPEIKVSHRVGGLDVNTWVDRIVRVNNQDGGAPSLMRLVGGTRRRALVRTSTGEHLQTEWKNIQPHWSGNPDLKSISEKEMSVAQTSAPSNGRLEPATFFRVAKFAETNRTALAAFTLNKAKDFLCVELNLSLSPANVLEVYEALGMQPRVPPKAAPPDVLTEAVLHLYSQLNAELPASLREVIDAK